MFLCFGKPIITLSPYLWAMRWILAGGATQCSSKWKEENMVSRMMDAGEGGREGGGACPLSPLDLGGGGDVKLLEERVVGSFFARQTGEEYNKL